jgi:hypothetical protein
MTRPRRHPDIAGSAMLKTSASDDLVAWILEGKLTQITPAHVLVASPSIQKKLIDRLRIH